MISPRRGRVQKVSNRGNTSRRLGNFYKLPHIRGSGPFTRSAAAAKSPATAEVGRRRMHVSDEVGSMPFVFPAFASGLVLAILADGMLPTWFKCVFQRRDPAPTRQITFSFVRRGNLVLDPRFRQNGHKNTSDSSEGPVSHVSAARGPCLYAFCFLSPPPQLGAFCLRNISLKGLVASQKNSADACNILRVVIF